MSFLCRTQLEAENTTLKQQLLSSKSNLIDPQGLQGAEGAQGAQDVLNGLSAKFAEQSKCLQDMEQEFARQTKLLQEAEKERDHFRVKAFPDPDSLQRIRDLERQLEQVCCTSKPNLSTSYYGGAGE